jgi:large subunit ribosomal protein L24
VQTTLLGLGIAIILALVSALVAPLVIDWNRYRPRFEQEASRLTGLAVRVNGTIEARILPTPRIKLADVAVGAAGQKPQIQAATLELEVSLGPLLRGEVQATELHLVAPKMNLGLDHNGAVDWPSISPSLSPDRLTISHLTIDDGQAVLTDAASGFRLVLKELAFKGDVRSFGGPFKGEGAFRSGDQVYGYRIAATRPEDGGALKLKVGVDPAGYQLTTEIEGSVNLEHGVPQFDGTLAARPVTAALARGERVTTDAWHLAGKLRMGSASASLQELAFQFGPEEAAINLSGSAELTLGEHPHLDGAISAKQVDLDRALATPDAPLRPPFVLIRSAVEAFFAAAAKPPIPTKIAVALDAMTLGGSLLESVHGNIGFDGKGWNLDGLELRAPGATEVKLSGRLDDSPKGLTFSGPASLETHDLKVLVARLEGRGSPAPSAAQTLSARGVVTIGRDRFALERMTATLDQENVTGRLAYSWTIGTRPAVLDGEIHAAALDVDTLAAFAKAAASDASFEVPHEVALVLDIGKARIAGVDAQTVNARVKLDAGVLHIERLSVGDLGGAALDVSGRIDDLYAQPRGRLTLDLDAKALAGVTGFVGTFAPRTADWFRRIADRLAPAKIHGVLTVERASASGSLAKLDLSGRAGALRVALNGQANGAADHPGDAVVRIDSRLDSDGGSALVSLLGLDRAVTVDQTPGQMVISAAGQLGGNLRVNGIANAGGFSAAVDGALRLNGDEASIGTLQVKVSAADLRPLRRAMTGQAGVAMPISARATVAVSDTDLSFTNLTVTAGKTSVRGRLGLKLSSPIEIDGDIAADDVDAGALSAMLLGLPVAAAAGGNFWSSELIGAGAFSTANGSVTFKFDHAAFSPTLAARDLTGVVRLQPARIAVNDIGGSIAGGRLGGELTFHRNADGFSGQGHIDLAGADAAKLFGSNPKAVDGLVTLSLQGDSTGLSPEGLIGALRGSGSIALTDVHFAGIDAGAFDTAIRTADQSGSVDAAKIRAAVAAVMDRGRLAVLKGSADLTMGGEQIRVSNATLQLQDGAELLLSGSLDFGKGAVDARMTLAGRPAANPLAGAKPELSVTLKGPLAAPERTVDVSSLLGWLTLRSTELQTRRLQSLEANGRPDVSSGPVVRPGSPAVRFLPLGTVLESGASANTPAPRGVGTAERLQPTPPGLVPDDTHSDAGATGRGAAAAIALPPTAPHTDNSTGITGTAAPPPRRATPAAPTPQAAPPQAAPRATAPAARSPLELLFGSHN